MAKITIQYSTKVYNKAKTLKKRKNKTKSLCQFIDHISQQGQLEIAHRHY